MAITYLDSSPTSKIQYIDKSNDVTANPLYRSNPTFRQDASYKQESTEPTGQRILNNTVKAAEGYTIPGAVGAVASIPRAIKTALGNSKYSLFQALGKTPAEFGPEFEAGKAAAGIPEGILPELRGAKARFPQPERIVPTKQPVPVQAAETLPSVSPASYPRDPNTFMNSARVRIQRFGNKLSPQEINDYKSQLSDFLNNGTFRPGTDSYAIASKLKKDVTALHNEVVPGREELNKIYALSKTFHPELAEPLTGLIKKFGKAAIKAAIYGTGIGAGIGLTQR